MAAFISNLQTLRHSMDLAKDRIEGTVTDRYRKAVRIVLKDLAANTPQWSGDLAASWQVVVGKGAKAAYPEYTPLKSDFSRQLAPKWKGDGTAVDLALQRAEFDIASIRWNSHVSIVNVSKTLTEGEGGPPLTDERQLRPGNFIKGDFMAVKYVAHKYAMAGGL